MTAPRNRIASALLAVAASCVTLAAASPALANMEQRSERVEFGDLNLGSENGVKRLNRRVSSAIKRVCGVHESRDVRFIAAARTCRKESESRASQDVELAIANYRSGNRLAARDVTIAIGAR